MAGAPWAGKTCLAGQAGFLCRTENLHRIFYCTHVHAVFVASLKFLPFCQRFFFSFFMVARWPVKMQYACCL